MAEPAARTVDYRHLTSSFPLARGYSDDQIAETHAAALTVLEELGVQVNHEGARGLLANAGGAVEGLQVRFGRDLVEAAIASSPPELTLTGAAGTLRIGARNTQLVPVGGPPRAMDTAHGKRSGTFEDCRNFIRLAQAFAVIHMTGPSVEPQDIDPRLRHLLVGGRARRLVREVHPRHRTAPARGGADAARALGRRGARPRRPARGRLGGTLLRGRPHDGTLPNGVLRPLRLGLVELRPVGGSGRPHRDGTGARSLGGRFSRTSGRPRSIRGRSRPSTPSSRGGRRKAERTR